MKRLVLSISVATSLLVGGCDNNADYGRLLGALGGGAAGGGLADLLHVNRAGTALVIVAGAAAGSFIGGVIGHALDQRDQQKAAGATQYVLAQPAPAYYTAPTSGAYSVASAGTVAPVTAKQLTVKKPNPASGAPSPPPSAQWKSDHTTTSGSATLVSVQPNGSGGECRIIREVAYIGGQEVLQDNHYCRGPNTDWQGT